MTASLLLTTSVDQRLNLWSYDSGESMLKLTSSFTHDVADVASMEVLRNRLAITTQNLQNIFIPRPHFLQGRILVLYLQHGATPLKWTPLGPKIFFSFIARCP